MNKPVLSVIAVMLVCARAQATVSNEVLYRMGEDGAGANNIPLDSSGHNRNYAGNAGTAQLLNGVGAVAGSTNYYLFAGTFYYGCTVAWPIPGDNLGVEVFVRVPAGYTNVVPGQRAALALVRHRTFTSFYANGVRQGDGLGTGGVPDQSATMHFGVEAGAVAHFRCEGIPFDTPTARKLPLFIGLNTYTLSSGID